MSVCRLSTLILLLSAAVLDGARTRKPAIGTTPSDCDTKGCSHECQTVGEFPLCVCPPDMALDVDGKTCKGTNTFLFAMFRGVRLYNEQSEEEVTLAPVKARCVDYHYGRKELYAYTNYTVMSYPIPKGRTASLVRIVMQTDTAVTSLAVDWVHDVIYYISEQQSTLGMTSLDDGDERTILSHNGSLAAGWRDLVVDPYAKKLFWIGSKGVFSSDLEGENLLTDLIDWIKPDKLALDISNQLIYIIGRRSGSSNKYISRASYNGSKAGEDIEISQPATVDIFGFGVVRNTAYWESNHGGENLFKIDLGKAVSTRKVAATIVAELHQIVYDMKVYHQDVQKFQKTTMDSKIVSPLK